MCHQVAPGDGAGCRRWPSGAWRRGGRRRCGEGEVGHELSFLAASLLRALASLRPGLRVASVRWPVRLQEHVVEAGLAQGEPERVGTRRRARRSASAPTRPVLDGQLDDASRRGGQTLSRGRRSSGSDLRHARGVGEGDSSDGRAEVGLELGRRAVGDDPPVVDHDDLLGQPVGLFEVLRREQDRGAPADQGLDDVPERWRLWGSRPVVGSSRKSTGGRATSAAARSRRRRMPPE